jgi:hypothetical protein
VEVSSHSQAAIETPLASVAHQSQGFHEEHEDIVRKPQQHLLPMLPLSGKVDNTPTNNLQVKPIKCDPKYVQGKKIHSQWSW